MTGDSCNEGEGKRKVFLPFGASDLAQACPSSCPQHCPYRENADPSQLPEPLGEPLSVDEVADLIGCSAWTIRQRYLAAGLPHLRLRPHTKLLFYKNQVIHWLLTEQQKGGTNL